MADAGGLSAGQRPSVALLVFYRRTSQWSGIARGKLLSVAMRKSPQATPSPS